MAWSSMERDLRRFAFTSARLITTRFPFWEAISTAMLLGELGQKARSYDIPDIAIYAHIGLCFLLATLMSFDSTKQRDCALISAFQMLCISFLSLLIWRSNGQFLVLKIFSRYLGISAAFLLLFGGFGDFRASNKRYTQLGRFCLGIALVIQAYLLYVWGTERSVFLRNLPWFLPKTGHIISMAFCSLLGLCATCFITNNSLNAASKCSLVLWIVVTILTDLDYTFWAGHIELWTQFRILAGDLVMISTFAVTFAMTS